MKYLMDDIFDFFEKLVRALFYLGASSYLARKAIIIIPQHPGIPDWLTFLAVVVCALGGAALVGRIANEPTSSQLREERKRAETNNKILADAGRRALKGDS